MMLISPQALDLAQLIVQERVQRAAAEALADSLAPHTSVVALTGAARLSLATSLRNLALRLDPSLGCEPNLALPKPR